MVGIKIRDSESTQNVDKAILHATVYVAIETVNQRALLLSQASNVFLSAYATLILTHVCWKSVTVALIIACDGCYTTSFFICNPTLK